MASIRQPIFIVPKCVNLPETRLKTGLIFSVPEPQDDSFCPQTFCGRMSLSLVRAVISKQDRCYICLFSCCGRDRLSLSLSPLIRTERTGSTGQTNYALTLNFRACMVTLNGITNELTNCDPVCQSTSKGQGHTATIMNPFRKSK